MHSYKKKRKRRSRLTLGLIALIFILPMLIAWFVFEQKNFLPPEKTSNLGQLIDPPVSLALFHLNDAMGHTEVKYAASKTKSATQSTGRWLLLYYHPGLCQKSCLQMLYYLHQIHMATGKNRDRIERAILTFTKSPNNAEIDKLLQHYYPDMRHYTLTDYNYQHIIKQYLHIEYANEPGTLYIVDPLGNVMMAYQPSINPNYILKDLRHLLTVSQIG